MIHFFMPFLPKADDTPIARCLKDLQLNYKIFSGRLRLRYKYRLWLILVGWPTIAIYGIKTAFKSLMSDPAPRVIVVYSHIEVLMVSIARKILGRHQTKIVLIGFILTERKGIIHNYFRRICFRFTLSLTSLVIVHSQNEANRYADVFSRSHTRFAFIPWAAHVSGLDRLQISDGPRPDGDTFIVSAGRSGRDYKTLFRAFQSTDFKVRIICNYTAALKGCRPARNIEIYDNCYGEAYLRQLWNAYCVVIPLAVNEISAGQMVLVQAMAMGKPIVITSTTTTAEYVTDGYDAFCVPPADPAAMYDAVKRLFQDQHLAKKLGTNARSSYKNRFSISSFVNKLIQEITITDPSAAKPYEIISRQSITDETSNEEYSKL